MTSPVTLTSVEFDGFKAFRRYSVRLQHMNILTGTNNCGKSTILSAFRVLDIALRIARSKSPEPLENAYPARYGYRIPFDSLPITVKNVHTDLDEMETKITFRLSNKNLLILYFMPDSAAILIAETEGKRISSPSDFRRDFPITIGAVPILGPLELEEQIVTDETVRRGLSSHRASYHFRNYWHISKEGFDKFAALIKKTWPGMEVTKPLKPDIFSKHLVMYCTENRITREIAWAGFDFQVWCQLLTSISTFSDTSILVIDEPEIYLHPDVQRQLVEILREAGPDILVATHSAEIMGEADPSELVIINKEKKTAERLQDIQGVQRVLEQIGSIQNVTLSHLARTKKLLFTEGPTDFGIIRRFSRILNFPEIASGSEITTIQSGGFSSWERIKHFAWGFEKALGSSLHIGAIFDNDYWPSDEIADVYAKCKDSLQLIHFHHGKEIENYLLIPSVLERTLEKAIVERERRSSEVIDRTLSASDILTDITNSLRDNVSAQYIAKNQSYFKSTGKDPATIAGETLNWVSTVWPNLQERLMIVPGKTVLRAFRDKCQSLYGITITDAKVFSEFHKDDIHTKLLDLIKQIDAFRQLK